MAPQIVLYTNHGCPWAHRAHIALAELNLQFEEHIVDLTSPRTEQYLTINPRGLVPSLIYDGQTITESAIVAQFLADSHTSHLLKASTEQGGALQRARINFFVDAFISKVLPGLFGQLRAKTEEERSEAHEKFVASVVKELEPLLQDASPFFGGSERLTLAEVQTGSFVLRIVDFSKYDLLHPDTLSELEAKAPKTAKWLQAVAAEKSVNHIWDAEKSATAWKKKFGGGIAK